MPVLCSWSAVFQCNAIPTTNQFGNRTRRFRLGNEANVASSRHLSRLAFDLPKSWRESIRAWSAKNTIQLCRGRAASHPRTYYAAKAAASAALRAGVFDRRTSVVEYQSPHLSSGGKRHYRGVYRRLWHGKKRKLERGFAWRGSRRFRRERCARSQIAQIWNDCADRLFAADHRARKGLF